MGRRNQILIGVVALVIGTATAASSADATTTSWSFDTPSYDFGQALAGGGVANSHEFVLTNTGESPITIEGRVIGWVGSDHKPFEVTETECLKGDILEPGESCREEFGFTPTTAGHKEGYAKVKAVGGWPLPAEIEFEGEGYGPAVSVEPDHLDFGSVYQGGRSPRRTITVENKGSTSLLIYWVQVGNIYGQVESSSFWVEGGTCAHGTVLPPLGECTIEVVLAPSQIATYEGAIAVSDNGDPGSPQLIELSGAGVERPPTPSWVGPGIVEKYEPGATTPPAPADSMPTAATPDPHARGVTVIECSKYEGAVWKPRACSPEATSVSFKRLRWSHWGDLTATATGITKVGEVLPAIHDRFVASHRIRCGVQYRYRLLIARSPYGPNRVQLGGCP